MAGVGCSPHPTPTNRPARVRTKNRQPARTTPKPTGRPGRAPKTGNQRAPPRNQPAGPGAHQKQATSAHQAQEPPPSFRIPHFWISMLETRK